MHDFLQLRNEVFVVEQNCIFQDLDGKDNSALHVFCKSNKGLTVAYARVFKPLDYYKEASIGRIVVDKAYRKQKIGVKLVSKAIEAIESNIGAVSIKIGAQTYLSSFYESFGFFKMGEEYIEDGIPHIYMLNHELLKNESKS